MHGAICIRRILTTTPTTRVPTVIVNSLSCKRLTSRMPSPAKTVQTTTELSADIISQLGKTPKMRDNPAFTKVDSDEFHSIFTPELEALVALFKKYNYELRIAGGAVRDILMKIKPKDVDLATTATPDQMKDMFNKEEVRMINAKGEKHGTITPRIHNKENFEVTTLRIDVRTDGRHADVVFTTNWQLDANRRDLTINSMFLGFDGTVYDYFYGYDDVLKRRVIFVGDADVRIKEDYLRILRYFRFYGRIAADAHSHDKTTLAAIKANANGLAKISGERIWAELQKIVVGNFGRELIIEMLACDLLKYCGLPAQPNITEFERICRDLEHFEQPHLPILYMISLVHSAEEVIQLHERLKLSAYERDLALFITQQRDRVSEFNLRPTELVNPIFLQVDSEYKTLNDYQKLCLQPFAKRDYVEQLLKYTNKLEIYNQLRAWQTPSFPVNGNMLKGHGLVGKKVGLVISELRLLWADSDFKLTADELLEKLPTILEHLESNSPSKKQRTQ